MEEKGYALPDYDKKTIDILREWDILSREWKVVVSVSCAIDLRKATWQGSEVPILAFFVLSQKFQKQKGGEDSCQKAK